MDWYEAIADFAGERLRVYIFAMRSMASGGAFHVAYFTPHNRPFWKRTSWRLTISAGCSGACATTT